MKSLLLAAVCCLSSIVLCSSTDLDTIATRIAASQSPPASIQSAFDDAIGLNYSFYQPNGTFSDLDYNYLTPAWWPAMIHPYRVRSFAAAWATPASRWYQSEELLTATHGLLRWWLSWDSGNGRSDNWWFNQVGVPDFMARTAIILQAGGVLAADELAGIVAETRLASSYANCEPTNCMWLASNVFLGGLLERNVTIVNKTLHDIFSTISIINPLDPSDPSGIKADNSFMMHGSLLYSGGYGMCYAYGLINLLAWTAGTSYALPPADPRWLLLSDFILEGSMRMMHFGGGEGTFGPPTWDLSAVGRDLVRPYGDDWNSAAGQAVSFSSSALAAVGGPRAADFEKFAALINGTSAASGVPPSFLSSSRYFYIAGYAVHTSGVTATPSPQLASWSCSAFCASDRTRRSEITNSENLKGWHLAENAMWTLITGYEYAQIFPTLDWNRLPGTTVLPAHTYTQADVGGEGVTSFVGGASDGVAATLSVNDFLAPNGVGLSYRKAVAFFSDAVVVLAANISTALASNSATAEIWTTVEQRRLPAPMGICSDDLPSVALNQTDIYTSANPTTPLEPGNYTLPADTWWLWEGSTGYIFLDRLPNQPQQGGAASLHVSAAVQSGNWLAIGAENGTVACTVFTLWLVHAAPVLNGSAAYAIIPAISLEAFVQNVAAIAANISIENLPTIQVVYHAGDNTLAAGVYAANGATAIVNVTAGEGGSHGTTWEATFSAPAAYLLKQFTGSAANVLQLAAANPKQTDWTTNVSWAATSGATDCTVSYALTSPPHDGSSLLLNTSVLC